MNSFRLFTKGIHIKFRESLSSVIPIIAIVLILCLCLVPVSTGVVLTFLIGGVLLVFGMMLFSLGSEMSTSQMGEHVGAYITRSRKLPVVVFLGLILGIIVTVAEPDLQVLANQVPNVPNLVLVLSVAGGVGVFLVIALLRMVFSIPLTRLLIIFYAIIFVMVFFLPNTFLAVAFDSGGVTTGPLTVPFIMALGVGVSTIRSDRHAGEDSFGLVALCSVGPIITVIILGMIYDPQGMILEETASSDVRDTLELSRLFIRGIPTYIRDMAVSMLPLILFMFVFQISALHLKTKHLKRIIVGFIYTYVGLVLFLTGANIGFMPAGRYLGLVLAKDTYKYVIIPIGMLMGYFIVRAEPAVYVLNKQVEEMTSGGVTEKAMGTALSVGVSVSVGLAMLRVLTGVSILYFLIPGYAIAIITSFFVPKLYTAIAFDSGGVASGPMTAAFLVPLAQGVCSAVGGDVIKDAFGVVAMVAMTPLITIQIMGLIAEQRKKKEAARVAMMFKEFELLNDETIIEL